MGKVLAGMTMSIDGFVNDRNGSVGALYHDFKELRETEALQKSMKTTGAVVMGKRSYEMGQGDFTGYEYQVPLFVVTHVVPATVAKGENGKLAFHFVTTGIESAIKQAKAAAGDKDVTVVGGPNIVQQCIKAGLLDELQVSIMPILLGEGLRFFEHLGPELIQLQKIEVLEAAQRTDITFRIVK